MVRAKVLAPITRLGRSFEKGDLIEVHDAEAQQLVAAGVIAVGTAPAPAAAAAVRASGPLTPPAKGRKR